MIRADAIVIGAGASGLAAGKVLAESGLSVSVVEARNRPGGRIATRYEPSWPVPVELGPEFIHGRPRETFDLLGPSGLLAVRLPDVQWEESGRSWERLDDFWRTADAITAKMRSGGVDRSVAAFLAAQRALPRRKRELFLSLVEGYHAAPPEKIGEHSLSTRGEEPANHDQFRVVNGYDRLTDWLARTGGMTMHLGATVRTVRWGAGGVEIETGASGGVGRLTAPQAIVTIPVGVWKAAAGEDGAIRFEPELHEKRRAMAKIEMGAVVKIVFLFRERIWDDPAAPPRKARVARPGLGFLHARGAAFPTWWTAEPLEVPVLTAWAGGRAASALAGIPEAEVAGRALETIAQLIGLSPARVSSRLVGWRMHDWQADPFSRGAYSYLGVGGIPARRALARPAGRALFFAGEATDSEQSGTVAGAIASGIRAARQLLRARRSLRHFS